MPEQPILIQATMIALGLALAIAIFVISLRFVNQGLRGNRWYRRLRLARYRARHGEPTDSYRKPDDEKANYYARR